MCVGVLIAKNCTENSVNKQGSCSRSSKTKKDMHKMKKRRGGLFIYFFIWWVGSLSRSVGRERERERSGGGEEH